MAILRLLCVLALSACYSPDLRECSVECRADDECGSGQVCSDRLCAAPGTSCSGEPPADAASSTVDAPIDTPPDPPPPTGLLRIKIVDQGAVEVIGVGTCDSHVANQCDFTVELDVSLTLVATPHSNRYLEKWEKACTGNQPTCTLTATAQLTEVEANFKKP